MLDSVYAVCVFGYVIYRRLLGCGQLDGVIVALAAGGAPILQRLQGSHRPCVVVGHRPNYPDIPWLDVDNMAGAKSMTEHLISLGHRRIATITGPLNSIAGHDRLDGYRLALAQAGIAGDDALVSEGDFTEESDFYAMKRLMHIVASNQTNVHFRLGHLG